MTTASKTYLVPAVVGAALFFLPSGVVAVVFAVKTRHLNEHNDLERATAASRMARRFMILTFFAGGLIYLSLILAFLALGAFSS